MPPPSVSEAVWVALSRVNLPYSVVGLFHLCSCLLCLRSLMQQPLGATKGYVTTVHRLQSPSKPCVQVLRLQMPQISQGGGTNYAWLPPVRTTSDPGPSPSPTPCWPGLGGLQSSDQQGLPVCPQPSQVGPTSPGG